MTTVLLTGMCRSGTTSSARFFQEFGIKSYHQKLCPGPKRNKPFNFLTPPDWALNYIEQKAIGIRKSGIGFEANWELCHYIYNLSRKCPDTKWIIMIRDPLQVCNSLKAYNRRQAEIVELAELYRSTYLSIEQQLLSLDLKGRFFWIDFLKYTRGHYIEALFALFGIAPSTGNRETAYAHLRKKVRSSGAYQLYSCELFDGGREITGRIRDLIKDHDALLLRQHGSLTVGKDLDAALTSLERIEHVSKVYWHAQMLGKVNRIPSEDVEKLLEIRKKFM